MKYPIGTILKHNSSRRGQTTVTVTGYDTKTNEYVMKWATGNINKWPEDGINEYLMIIGQQIILPEELFTL